MVDRTQYSMQIVQCDQVFSALSQDEEVSGSHPSSRSNSPLFSSVSPWWTECLDSPMRQKNNLSCPTFTGTHIFNNPQLWKKVFPGKILKTFCRYFGLLQLDCVTLLLPAFLRKNGLNFSRGKFPIGSTAFTKHDNNKWTSTCKHTCFLLSGGALGLTGQKDGFAVPGLELLLCTQKARHQEVKQRPEVKDIVLYGCAWQDEAMPTDQLFGGFG